MSIKLGDKVKDRISDFTGIATARVEYLTGCVQFCVTPKVSTDGKLCSGEYFDESRLDIAVDRQAAGLTAAANITNVMRER